MVFLALQLWTHTESGRLVTGSAMIKFGVTSVLLSDEMSSAAGLFQTVSQYIYTIKNLLCSEVFKNAISSLIDPREVVKFNGSDTGAGAFLEAPSNIGKNIIPNEIRIQEIFAI